MATKKESLAPSSAFVFPPARGTKEDVKEIEEWISDLEEGKALNQMLIEGNQMRLANAQEKQQDPSNPVERREEMGMEVQAYESHIQTSQQNIERIEADLRVERSALQAMESEEFLRNIKKYIQNSGSVDRFLAHLVFVGLPGSGKSTLIARLLNLVGIKEMLKANDSTGVMNGVITVDVAKDGASLHPASTMGDSCEWQKADFKISCFRQMGSKCLVLTKRNLAPSDNEPSRKRSKTSQKKSGRGSGKQVGADVMAHVDTSVSEASRARMLDLLEKEDFSDIRPFLDNKFSLYLSDTGGQIEFQELLPLLVAGVAIFIFIFPLNVDLDKPVAVSYRKKVGDEIEHTNEYTSSLTIKESFLQTLASIDSMEASADPTIAKHNPYVFVVGTHKDCLIKELGEDGAATRIREIDNSIKGLIKEHKYEDLAVYADKATDRVLFAVDNTSEGDVFRNIRSRVVDLVKKGDEFRIRFPISYLQASLDLQESDKPFIKRKDFAASVLRYGITEEDVDHVLYFLHSRIGQIRYFPINGLKELIVREPQSLYNLVSCLIIQSFVTEAITMAKYSEVQRGIYSMDSLHVEEFASLSEFVTPKQVVGLLKELRIIAPFYDHNAEVEKYFIPCVLNHLSESPEEDKPSSVQSLFITFKCGHCPKGMFGVLLHYILTHEDKKLEWNLDINKIFRDQVSFEVGPYGDAITIKFCTSCLEMRCHPSEISERDESFSIKNICNMVRSTLTSGIEQATDCLHYSRKKTAHSLALFCDVCNKVCNVTIAGTRHVLTGSCLQSRHDRLPDPACVWFGSVLEYSFPDLMESQVVHLKEDASHQIPFEVRACEPPQAMTGGHVVSKEAGTFRPQCVYVHGNTLYFQRVKRSDAGTYFIRSSNALLEGTASFKLRVKFPPEYILEQSYLETVAGTSPSVRFSVISEPPLDDDTKHTLSSSTSVRVSGRFMIENDSINFPNVCVSNSRVYTISCCNDDGEVGKAEIELVVTPKPKPDSSDQASANDVASTMYQPPPPKFSPQNIGGSYPHSRSFTPPQPPQYVHPNMFPQACPGSQGLHYPVPLPQGYPPHQQYNPAGLSQLQPHGSAHVSGGPPSWGHLSGQSQGGPGAPSGNMQYPGVPAPFMSAGSPQVLVPPRVPIGYAGFPHIPAPPHVPSGNVPYAGQVPAHYGHQYVPQHGQGGSQYSMTPGGSPSPQQTMYPPQPPTHAGPLAAGASSEGLQGVHVRPLPVGQVPAHYGHQNVPRHGQGGSQHSMPPDDSCSYVRPSPRLPRDTAAQPMAHHQVSSLAHGMSPQGNFSSPQTPTQHSVLRDITVRDKDVGFLMGYLCQHSYKWGDIGTALHFLPGELENIRHSPQVITPQQCLNAILCQWVQWPTTAHSQTPTMEMLRDALRSDVVGLGAVANKLYDARNYLPSQLDYMMCIPGLGPRDAS